MLALARARKLIPLAVVVAVVGIAVPVTIVVQRGHSARSPAAAGPEERLWTGTATLLQVKGGDVVLCGGSILTSMPPAGCGGAVVRGLDPTTVEGAHNYGNGTVTTPSVRLVGTWDGHALTVTKPPVRAEQEPPPVAEIPGPSCPEPAGGWPFDRVDSAGWTRVHEYAAAQPDAGAVRVDTSQRIMTVPFTGGLDRHRADIAKLYDGPVCVEQVDHSSRELQSVFHRVEADLKVRGIQLLFGDAGGAGGSSIDVTVVAVSPAQKAEIEKGYDGMLRLASFLQPV